MYCRQCGSHLPIAVTFCDVCGAKAADPRPVQPFEPEESYRTKIILDSAELPQHAPTQPPQGRKKQWLLPLAGLSALLLILGTLGGLGLYWILDKPTPRSSITSESTSTSTVTASKPAESVTKPTITPAPRETAPQAAAHDPSFPPARVTKYVHPTYQAWHYRINFAPGSSGGVVKDRLPRLVRYYIIHGQAGQSMTVSLVTPTENGYFSVLIENGQRDMVRDVRGSWSAVLPETGDYSIFVYRGDVPNGPAMPFEMTVSIN